MDMSTDLLAGGLLQAYSVALIAGILSVATPCVLPMLPITLSILGASKETSRRRSLAVSAVYVAGIVLCFTALGIFSALTGSLFGSLLGHPVTAIVLATIFVLLSGSSFDLYELRLPNALMQRFSSMGGAGFSGAFVMGLVAGFIAVPCIGPVLLGILTYVSTNGNVVVGATLLATYALGFGLPFMVIAVFSLTIPKRGSWMRAVKSVFGVALLVTAFWFLSGAFHSLREHANSVAGAFLVIFGIVIGALHRHFDGSTGDRVRKALGIIALTAGSVLLLNVVLAPPPQENWCQETGDGACIASACATHERTVVDFGAEWCPACKKLQNITFADSEVRKRLKSKGLVYVDVDRAEALAKSYNLKGVPEIVFLDNTCHEVKRVEEYTPPQEFNRILDSL